MPCTGNSDKSLNTAQMGPMIWRHRWLLPKNRVNFYTIPDVVGYLWYLWYLKSLKLHPAERQILILSPFRPNAKPSFDVLSLSGAPPACRCTSEANMYLVPVPRFQIFAAHEVAVANRRRPRPTLSCFDGVLAPWTLPRFWWA